MWGTDGMKLTTKVLGLNPAPVPFYQPQIPHGLTQASTMKGWQLRNDNI